MTAGDPLDVAEELCHALADLVGEGHGPRVTVTPGAQGARYSVELTESQARELLDRLYHRDRNRSTAKAQNGDKQ